jgi:hypothetical protein
MSSNPLLARIKMPGETFRLPSGGLFYPPGVLSENVTDGEIRVGPMTAIDEIALKTPDLLFSGDAVKEVFARCIPDVLQPEKMLAKDVDFLLICLRKVSYGPQLEITYEHNCEKAKEHSYLIDVGSFIRKSKRIDPTRVTRDFTVALPNGQVVEMQPIAYRDYISLLQAADSDESPEQQAKRLANSVSRVIKKVDDVTDREFIEEWLAKIPPILLKKVTEAIDKTTEWGPDFMADIQCKDCGREVQVQAPLNPLGFFT